MLKGSINTRENILRRFKPLPLPNVKTTMDVLRVDEDFVDLVTEAEEDGGKDYLVDNKNYTYMADEIVDIRPDSINDTDSVIITFRVCTFAMKPFLQFMLVKNKDKLQFPSHKVASGDVNSKSGTYYGKVDDTEVQMLLFKEDCPRPDEITEVSSSDPSFWVSVHEAINDMHSFGIEIDSSVRDHLLSREELIYLQNEDGNLIETPMASYRGEYYKKMAFIAGLGMPRSGPYSSLGPYYYFADFHRSLRYACITLDGIPKQVFDEYVTRDDTPVFTKGGMVKFMLFLGRTKVLLNHPDDPSDDSDESVKLAGQRGFFKSLLKLRDSSGKWAQEYDSVIQPLMKVYDPELKRERELDAQIIVKQYSQQSPIQYAYFNTDMIDLNSDTGFYNIDKATLI